MIQRISTINQIRNANISIVKSTLRQIVSGTKNDVSRLTGLSVATCSTILNELAKTGEVIEVFSQQPGFGRPPKLYQYDKEYAHICCISITNEQLVKALHYSVTNLMGEVFIERSIEIEQADFDTLHIILQAILDTYPRVRIISIGISGVVFENRIESSSIPELNRKGLVKELEEALNCLVIMENDMNATAYGLYYEGMAETPNALVVLSFFKDSCPGSGIVLGGDILRENTNFSGEISYLPYRSDREWKEISQNPQHLLTYITDAVVSLNVILNPEIIILTGKTLDQDFVEELTKEAAKFIPPEHFAHIRFIRNTQPYFIKGLMALALEHMDVTKDLIT